jgi:pilus assembly protein CpaE
MMPDIDGVTVTRQLRASPETKDIPIIMFTAKTQLEDKLGGFEAGADAYLTKPTQPRELVAQVKAVLALSQRNRAAIAKSVPVQRERGFVVGVISAKGGLGVSTLALNLGASLLRHNKKDVVVADFRPGCGTIGLELGYSESQGLNRLLEMGPAEITVQTVEPELVRHASQLRLLLSSFEPQDAKYQNAVENFVAIAQQLAYLARYTILDLGPSLTPVNDSVIERCNLIIVVLEPVTNTIIQTKAMVEYIQSVKGMEDSRIMYSLVNRVRTGMQLSSSQVQDQFGRHIAVLFPAAPEQLYQASLAHLPIVNQQPESVIAQQFSSFVERVIQRGG